MGGNTASYIVFLCLMAQTISQETTTIPATTASTNEIVKETGICRKCRCVDTKVDCNEEGLTTFFSSADWAALKDFKPTHVDLSDNSFPNITAMAELPVQVLNLSRCNIELIAFGSFRDLQEMVVLDLSHNKLTYEKLSPHSFEGRYSAEEYEPLRSMRTLDLSYNNLHSLHQDLFEHMPELSELNLSGNPLGTADHVTLIAISSLPMLKILRMRSCNMDDIPDRLLHTPQYLEQLDISNNQLKAVPQELGETKNLVYLNLNQNPIEELDYNSHEFPGFPTLKKLKELHMCNMPKLVRVGISSLANLQSLEKLHMSFNEKLSYIDPKALARPDDIGEMFDYPPLTHLYLQSNNLTMLDSRLLARWDKLQDINVSDNPWLCDCSTQWMVSNLVTVVEGLHANASAEMACQEPIEMRGYNMKKLHELHREMRCLDKYGHRPERDGSILLGTLIGVLLAVPIMLALVLMWRQGYFACLGLRGPASFSRAFYKRAPADDNYI
ncbi:leucine-rich repeat neuronal protein 3-like [Plodia interpunctella]|uniref:leucine-rich repeat neuronal protein 3-like n=1 Tax=Plodia interpunctella TaxID=58824 RepID=UPI0023680F32|nr:leucine-rich repeat neuronal protein 3-like [Plodia interpunctella]